MNVLKAILYGIVGGTAATIGAIIIRKNIVDAKDPMTQDRIKSKFANIKNKFKSRNQRLLFF